MQGFKLVLKKELTRVLTDKKMIFSLFILPIILIVGIYGLMFKLIGNENDKQEEYKAKVYVQYAPDSFKEAVKTLDEKNNIKFVDGTFDVTGCKSDIKNGDTELLIVFPEDIATGIQDDTGKNLPNIRTYYNPTEDYSNNARNQYSVILEQYRLSLLSDKIGDLSKIMVFTVDALEGEAEESQVYDDVKASGKILGMLVPYIVTIMLFAGAMSLGVDTFTGEKERGTMSSLLITPVNRISIAMGKMVALMILSVMSAATYVVSMIISMPLITSNVMSDDAFSELKISLSGAQLVEFALIVIALVYLYVSIVSVVAVLAKTSKEASSYVMPAYMLVLVVGMLTMYGEASKDIKMFAIPVYNGPLALKALFTQSLTVPQCAITVIVTLATAFLITFIIAKLFNNEKVMSA